MTIILIDSNEPKIATDLCYNKGCNYYSFSKSEDIEKYIDTHLNYMLFPHSYDYDVVYTCGRYTKWEVGVTLRNRDITNEKE